MVENYHQFSCFWFLATNITWKKCRCSLDPSISNQYRGVTLLSSKNISMKNIGMTTNKSFVVNYLDCDDKNQIFLKSKKILRFQLLCLVSKSLHIEKSQKWKHNYEDFNSRRQIWQDNTLTSLKKMKIHSWLLQILWPNFCKPTPLQVSK